MTETSDRQEPETDEELARLVLAGDIEAFARLYERHLSFGIQHDGSAPNGGRLDAGNIFQGASEAQPFQW